MNLDVFETNKDSILAQNNGKVSIIKTAFRKELKQQNRDDTFKNVCDEIGGMPNKNECVLFKSNGLSDTGSIFKYILDSCKNLDELYLSTWVINRQNIDMLINAIDKGFLKKLTFVVSIRLKQLEKSNYAHLIEQFRKYPQAISFKVVNSHAKTFSVSDTNGNFYTVTGSGNWTQNPRIENYIILNDIEAYNHNKDWMNEIVNK